MFSAMLGLLAMLACIRIVQQSTRRCEEESEPYSYRRATVGSMRRARRAGR